MKRGDRVRIVEHTAKSFMRATEDRRIPIDWTTREGIVRKVSLNHIAIMWPGRKSPDIWPSKAVELVVKEVKGTEDGW